MLAYRDPGGLWQAWQPGTRLPAYLGRLTPAANAEAALSDAELAALGLARVTRESVTEAMRATGWSLVDDGSGKPVLRPALVADDEPEHLPVAQLLQRLEAAGKLDAFAASLSRAQLLKLLAGRSVTPADTGLRQAIVTAGADPDAILGPLPTAR